MIGKAPDGGGDTNPDRSWGRYADAFRRTCVLCHLTGVGGGAVRVSPVDPKRAKTWAVIWVVACLVLATVAPGSASDADTSGLGGGGPAPVLVAASGVSVEDAGVHQPAVDALRARFPTVFDGTGCDGGLCPSEALQRWEMAVWLVRVLDRTNPSPQAGSRFADVAAGLWWGPYTDRLAELGVTAGCGTGPLRFCPNNSVTRAQMASFLVRAFDLEPGPAAGFTDTGRNVHAANIDAVAAARVTAGCKTSPLRYCPTAAVTRAQMATFLARAVGLVPLPRVEAAVPLIAYTGDVAGESTIVVVDAAGGNKRRLAAGGSGPIWSPDGSRVLYRSGNWPDYGIWPGTVELWVIDADGSNRRRLGSGGGYPLWSPDSTRIAYGSDGLWVVNADGTGRERLVRGNAWNPIWSPDSSRIAYTDGTNLFVADMDGTSRQITSDGGADPVWSPDSSRVFHLSGDDIPRDLAVVDVDGTDRRTLVTGVRQLVMSPDGAQIAYTQPEGGIWVVGSDGNGRKQLTGPGYWHPVWSPDGSHIFATFHDYAGWPLGLVIADTGANTVAEISPGGVFDPAWLPDSRSVVYNLSVSGVGSDIYVLGVDGSNRQLTTNRTEKDCVAPSPDGRHIVYSADAGVFVLNPDGTNHTQLDHTGKCPTWSPR